MYNLRHGSPINDFEQSKTASKELWLRGDIQPLLKAGWRVPEPFVAKGRDGVTDIWGVDAGFPDRILWDQAVSTRRWQSSCRMRPVTK